MFALNINFARKNDVLLNLCQHLMRYIYIYIYIYIPCIWPSKAGQSAQTYIQQLCEDTGCSPEHLPEAMNDREKWRERVRDICASGTTWWWWWYICIYIYIYINYEDWYVIKTKKLNQIYIYIYIYLVWVLCFNGISIFMFYLMPKQSFSRNPWSGE